MHLSHPSPSSLLPPAGRRRIALIGGMGPEAGLDALARFLAGCRKQLSRGGHPISDQAYPPHLLVQFDIPDRTAALLDGGEDPLPALVDACGVARAAGARITGIACNTAHFWHRRLAERFPEMEILHIARETARHMRERGVARCALLATLATQRGGLYQRALSEVGIEVLAQDEPALQSVHEAIFLVKAGRLDASKPLLRAVVESLAPKVDTIVLGCTELGLALDPAPIGGTVLIDAADVLAEALVERAYGSP